MATKAGAVLNHLGAGDGTKRCSDGTVGCDEETDFWLLPDQTFPIFKVKRNFRYDPNISIGSLRSNLVKVDFDYVEEQQDKTACDRVLELHIEGSHKDITDDEIKNCTTSSYYSKFGDPGSSQSVGVDAVLSPCVDKTEYENLKKRAPVSKKFRYLGCAGDLFSSTWWDYPQNVQRCTPGPDGFCDDESTSCGDGRAACPLVPVHEENVLYYVDSAKVGWNIPAQVVESAYNPVYPTNAGECAQACENLEDEIIETWSDVEAENRSQVCLLTHSPSTSRSTIGTCPM